VRAPIAEPAASVPPVELYRTGHARLGSGTTVAVTTPSGPRADKHVVMLGLMGAGKTTIGRRVARRLGRRFVDSDEELETRTGKTARTLLAERGVDGLHGQEAAVVEDILQGDEPVVFGAPASVVLSPALRARLQQEDAVWLRADPHWLAEKMRKKDDEYRPFVDHDPEVLVRQETERAPLFEAVARYVVESTNRDKDEVADEIVRLLAGNP
jgi:shikimate kinase